MALAISWGWQSLVVQASSDRDHALAFRTEAEDSTDNFGLRLIDLSLNVVPLWPSVGIEQAR